MFLPYKTRRFLRGLGTTVLVLALILVLAWVVWMLWLDRYIVYTRDGAKLDFSLPEKVATGQIALPPENEMTVSIYYNEGENTLNISTEMGRLYGYYITADMIENNMDMLLSQVKKLPPQTPVMLDVKDIIGRFYFQSDLGPIRTSMASGELTELLRILKLSNCYLIAKFPALRDYYYGLDHVSDGIFLKSGMGLWMDDNRCYWLNPQSQGTLSYIIQIITELKLMVFNEVVLDDFSIPTSEKLRFDADRDEALATAAKKILETCATERFAVSFCVNNASFQLPEGRSRLYMKNQSASELKSVAEQTALADPTIKLVFITDLNDTRFDDYSVMRPLDTAQFEEE